MKAWKMTRWLGLGAALVLMALCRPADAQQSEARSILDAIVAKARVIEQACVQRTTYFCVTLQSASLTSGQLRINLMDRARNSKGHIANGTGVVEAKLQSVHVTMERFEGYYWLMLVCQAGNCIDVKWQDQERIRRDSQLFLANTNSANLKQAEAEAIVQLFNRLIALCRSATC